MQDWAGILVPPLIGAALGILASFFFRRRRTDSSPWSPSPDLTQSQKLEVVGRMAGGVAHDFNNILTVILGFAQMMLQDMKPDHPMRKELEEICQAANRGAALTRQLLAFGRRQVVQPKSLRLNSVVASTLSMMHRVVGEQIRIQVSLSPRVSPVRADASQLEQVLMNLILNARDAMPKGGVITVETADETLPASAAQEAGLEPGTYAAVRVTDTGVGMNAQTLSRLFEPFFTTKPQGKGTGLGLATVQGIVKQAGGGIHVESEPDRGSAFSIFLPRLADEAPREIPQSTLISSASCQGTETVLLVEDDDALRSFLEHILQTNRYKVLAASDGAKALDLAFACSDPIHILVTDMVMPHVGGMELYERLKARRPSVRVFFISGHIHDPAARALELGPEVAFLQKPFAPKAFLSKVREVLDSSPTG